MAEIEEYFVDSGIRPGFSGNHGPGWYLVDYENRTIRPKPVEPVNELPVEETPVESHPSANNEGLATGGVIPAGNLVFLGDGSPELVVAPSGATISPNITEAIAKLVQPVEEAQPEEVAEPAPE